MTTTTSTDDVLSYADIAQLTGLSAGTLRGYRTHSRMPEPDASLAVDRPRWRRATIEHWLANRPGRGAPGVPGRRGRISELDHAD